LVNPFKNFPEVVPEVAVPEVAVPEVAVPEVAVPEVAVPEVAVPEVAVPEAKVTSIDLNNTQEGLSETIRQQWQAIDLAGYRLTGLFERRCEVSQGQSCIQGGISGRRSKDTRGSSINLNFTQSLAKGMYFGVVLDRNLNNGVSKQIDAKNIVPAMAFYMGWDQNDNRHGWGLMTGLGYMRDRLDIQRVYKPNTEKGRGHANLRGFSFITQARYTFQMDPSLELTPYGELRYSSFKRNAYSEDTIFKTEYDELKSEKYIARAGVKLNKQLDQVFSVGIGAGADIVLSQKTSGGTSNMPELNGLSVASKLKVPSQETKKVSAFGQAQIQANLKNKLNMTLSGALYGSSQGELGLTFSKRW